MPTCLRCGLATGDDAIVLCGACGAAARTNAARFAGFPGGARGSVRLLPFALSSDAAAIMALARAAGEDALGVSLVHEGATIDHARRALAEATWLQALQCAGSWQRH